MSIPFPGDIKNVVTVQPSASCCKHQAMRNCFAVGLMPPNHYAFSRTSQRSAKSWAELLQNVSVRV